MLRSSGLAYATLLALVPFLVVLFAVLSAMGSLSGIENMVQQFLVDTLVPTKQGQILDYLQTFLENTQTIGAVGLGFFSLTSLLLLNNIEQNFNSVWGAKSDRSIGDIVKVYASVLIFGSILVGASFSVTTWIGEKLISLSELSEFVIFQFIFTNLIPVIFLFIALLLMIKMIPNGKVAWKGALLGAGIGSVLWQAAQKLFTLFISKSITFSVVYGSIAVVPIFLIWLYICWIIIMIALEMCYVHQHITFPVYRAKGNFDTPRDHIAAGIDIFLHIAEEYKKGNAPPARTSFDGYLSVPTEHIQSILDRLESGTFLREVKGEGDAYVPARPLDSITLKELVDTIMGENFEDTVSFLSSETGPTLSWLRENFEQDLETVTVKDVLEQRTGSNKGKRGKKK